MTTQGIIIILDLIGLLFLLGVLNRVRCGCLCVGYGVVFRLWGAS